MQKINKLKIISVRCSVYYQLLPRITIIAQTENIFSIGRFTADLKINWIGFDKTRKYVDICMY